MLVFTRTGHLHRRLDGLPLRQHMKDMDSHVDTMKGWLRDYQGQRLGQTGPLLHNRTTIPNWELGEGWSRGVRCRQDPSRTWVGSGQGMDLHHGRLVGHPLNSCNTRTAASLVDVCHWELHLN